MYLKVKYLYNLIYKIVVYFYIGNLKSVFAKLISIHFCTRLINSGELYSFCQPFNTVLPFRTKPSFVAFNMCTSRNSC